MRNLIKRCESGLTLVEMLTAVSIIIIMAGSTYAVFNTGIKTYQRTQTKFLQAQRCRFAMDHIVTDLSQIQADTSDEMLALYSEDRPTASGDKDILSFVTLVKTDPDPFVAEVDAANVLATPPLSDVRRVAYYVGPKVPMDEMQSGNVVPPPYSASQAPEQNTPGQEETLTLYRIVTTALNPELVVDSFMNTGTVPTVDENGMPIHFEPYALIDGIVNFDLKYIDGESESVYESWDQTDAVPLGVLVLISVIDDTQESASRQTFPQTPGVMPQGALTQSTTVSLPASANTSSE
jgi:type II secretory pathway component PulJ